MDLYLTDAGDVTAGHSGDFEITPTSWRDDLQQAYIRVMTEEGDFLVYPTLGATLNQLYGMPQSPGTGAYAEALVKSALNREGRFIGSPVSVKAVPTGPQTLRIDVTILSGNFEKVKLSVEQSLVSLI